VLSIARLRGFLPTLDLYKLNHNHIIDDKMLLKATNIGGIFTIAFLVSAIFVPLFSLVYYALDNTTESKALVPLFITEKDFDGSLTGDIKINA
jgi:hypothetical protein